MKITDKDGKKYKIILRGRYKKILSAQKLFELLDRSVSQEGLLFQYPHLSVDGAQKLADCYKSKSYLQIMRDFGILDNTFRL